MDEIAVHQLRRSSSLIKFLDILKIRQRISHKISYGYALALGTAVLGTGLGLALGNYYSQQAQDKANLYTTKTQLLNELNSQVLSIQNHPLRLLAVAGDSRIWLQYETNKFATDLRHVQRVLDDVDQLTTLSNPENPENPETQTLKSLSNEYRTVLKTYDRFTQALWQDLRGSTSKSETNRILSFALSDETVSDISLQFEQLSEDLIRLRQRASQEQQRAEALVSQAETLRLTIILMSMTVSIGLAIILAMITSRTIARPIEQVTTFAQQVTESTDFALQAPITTEDEVSLLTKALNQLVSWAGHYTEELQQARDTLEERVQDRTQALQQSEDQLRQKAEDLQGTLTELQKTQLQLIQSEKMSSLGQMVAGVAHEIHNPVSFIHGNLQHTTTYTEDLFSLLALYQQHYPNPDVEIEEALADLDLEFIKQDFPNMVQSMHIGTERIKEIVLSLRTFSRLDEASVKAVNIHDGLESTLTLLQNRLRPNGHYAGVQVIKQYGQLPTVECYAGQLNQVFMNILSNAIDALTDDANAPKQELSESMSAQSERHRTTAVAQTAPPKTSPTIQIVTQHLDDQTITIQITDNGPGISPAVQKRLFDPFFTTKAVGQGTGMGLSISYQIVTDKHNGQLTCQSTPGEGTTFTIQIPLCLNL